MGQSAHDPIDVLTDSFYKKFETRSFYPDADLIWSDPIRKQIISNSNLAESLKKIQLTVSA